MTEPPHDPKMTRAQAHEDEAMRHLFGTMVCPRCGRPLDGCDHAQGIAWRCRRCGGQSLNFSQFRRMVPHQGANAIWDTATARPVPPRRRTACPECHSGMAAVNLPLNGRMVELDICLPCQRLWLDRQEEDAAASFSLSVMPPAEGAPRVRSWFGARRGVSEEDDEDEGDGKPGRQSPPDVVSVAILIAIGAGVILWQFLGLELTDRFKQRAPIFFGVLIIFLAVRLLRRL